jgi:hypothetical protein
VRPHEDRIPGSKVAVDRYTDVAVPDEFGNAEVMTAARTWAISLVIANAWVQKIKTPGRDIGSIQGVPYTAISDGSEASWTQLSYCT